ncbi:Gustatory receptor 5a, partial [Carabus blaptoides fortunei]
HLLYILKTIRIAENCPNFQTDPLKTYCGIAFTHVFTVIPYAHWKILLPELPSILETFQWNFLDLFLVLLSSALAERFKQINKTVLHTQVKDESFWREIREDYTKLWTMCQTINDSVCHLVSLSFGGNLFFICWQMFNSVRPMTGTVQTIYFCYSFGYLVGRTLVVSMYCCWINDEGKEVLASLFNLASQHYGPE